MDKSTMASRGQRAMRAKQSAAEKAFWPLQAGRPRLLPPSLLEAVHLGRVSATKLYTAVREAGLRLEDASCTIACYLKMKSDARVQPMGRFNPDGSDADDLELARNILNEMAEPLGVVFFLIDQEKGVLLLHARPFDSSERSKRLLANAVKRISLAHDERVELLSEDQRKASG